MSKQSSTLGAAVGIALLLLYTMWFCNSIDTIWRTTVLAILVTRYVIRVFFVSVLRAVLQDNLTVSLTACVLFLNSGL